MDFSSGAFPWLHNSRTPLVRKDGGLNVTGQIEGAWTDETDPIRANSEAEAYETLTAAWANSSGSGSLTVALADFIATEVPRAGFETTRYLPFRAAFQNMGVPTITIAA